MDTRKSLAYGQDRFEEAYALLKSLGTIPSPSHSEDLRAGFVRAWFEEAGFTDVSVDAAKNVIVSLGDDGANELVVFAAHTDVVFPDTEPLPMREEDGRLYAPGIGDDTACLVSMMLAARHLRELMERGIVAPKTGVLIVANSCEEGLGNLDGMKELFRERAPRVRAFVSFDSVLPMVVTSAVGSYRYRIRVRTQGGHSYKDFGNANAIHILSRIICDLYRIDIPQKTYTTTNVGVIEGGTSVNSIAQDANVLYEFRSTSQECLERMQASFDRVIAAYHDVFASEPVEITVELLGVRPGNGDVDEEALARLAAVCGEVMEEMGGQAWVEESGSTDANIPLSLGIPAATTGTYRGAGAHTREEYVELDSLAGSVSIALGTMIRVLEEFAG